MTSFSQDTGVHTATERSIPGWYAHGVEGLKTAPNIGMAERVGTGMIAATALAGAAWLANRRHYAVAAPLAVSGFVLVGRAVSGQCMGYRFLGVDPDDASTTSHPMSRRLQIRQSFHVNRSPDELYQQWRNLESLPNIMRHVVSVETSADGMSRWVTEDVGQGRMCWEARLTEDTPDRRIAWEAVGEKGLEHEGAVSFEPAPGGRGTILRVDLTYRPPAGAVGAAIAKMIGRDPSAQLREDLRQFKHRMEAGESPTTHGQPRGSCGR